MRKSKYSNMMLCIEIKDLDLKKNGETDSQRMARKCKTAMNSVNKDLEFTTETADDYDNKKLQPLNFPWN